MTQATFGWPLPVPGDVPDVPYDVTQLADGIAADLSAVASDLQLLDTRLGGGGKYMTGGYRVGAADSSGQIAVTFPAVFSAPPVVMAALGEASATVVSAVPIYGTLSNLGFTVQLYRFDGSKPTSGTYRVVWLAVGDTTL